MILFTADWHLKLGQKNVPVEWARNRYYEFFNQVKEYFKTGKHAKKPSILERIKVARRHLEMSIKWKGERLGILETRRHYSNYFKGIQDFKQHRTKLVTLETVSELMDVFAMLEQENETFVLTA